MAKSVEANSPITIRLQVRSLLLDEIKSGLYRPNQRIPSERDLAERYRVSRASVREAIAELISTGVLFRAGGRGTFVAERRPGDGAAAQQFHQFGFWISSEIFHFVQSGYTRILTGVEEVCRSQGYALEFHSVNEEKESLEPLFSPNPQRPAPAGHIIAGGLRSSTLDRLQHLGKPLVLVDPLMRRQPGEFDCVRIDYASGTRQAVRHLAELGHREIGFIGFASSEKYEAYWRALEEFQLPYLPRFVQFLEVPDLAPSVTVGFQRMNALLSLPASPSAVLVVNDYIALGALDALSISGLSVPDHMSIVGFDDIGEGSVPLTTVRCDLVEAGHMAAHRLIERLDRPEMPPGESVLPVNLIVRRSTAPPPRESAKSAG
jgi:GntR family transcriptional regulator, arabinose operon transcriptional repressor